MPRKNQWRQLERQILFLCEIYPLQGGIPSPRPRSRVYGGGGGLRVVKFDLCGFEHPGWMVLGGCNGSSQVPCKAMASKEDEVLL